MEETHSVVKMQNFLTLNLVVCNRGAQLDKSGEPQFRTALGQEPGIQKIKFCPCLLASCFRLFNYYRLVLSILYLVLFTVV